MKWSQQKKKNLSITTLLELKKINANHAKEGTIKIYIYIYIYTEEEYKQVISILNHQKQAMLAG